MSSEKFPKGYMQTKVGMIPYDWEVIQIHELVRDGPKNGYSGRSGKESRGTPTLSLSATSSGSLILNRETIKFLDETIPKDSDLFLRPNDVLVQRSNTIDLVGTTAIFQGPSRTYIYPDLMSRLRFRDSITAQWFWKYANSIEGRRFFTSIAAGSTGSMPKISGEKLRQMPIPLPSISERTAIATTLSDTDALIEALEQLIAKKRHIKQGTMQELLTGKRRLPGFGEGQGYKQTEVGVIPEDWKLERLSQITSEIGDGIHATPTYSNNGNYFFINGNNILNGRICITQETKRCNSVEFKKYKKNLNDRTILISINGTIGNVGLYSKEPIILGKSAAYICIHNEISERLVYYYLQTDTAKQYFNDGLTGTTIKNLGLGAIRTTPIAYPPSQAEQEAIATILTDMDTEIATLEAKLTKTRQLKQGMMHNLLTGRIRLV